MGLLNQTSPTDRGRFAFNRMAHNAAATIWKGMGIQPQNRPMANALVTECRFKCQRLGSCNTFPRNAKDLFCLIESGSGRYFLINSFDILNDRNGGLV